MSLNNITLTSPLAAQLYTNVLVQDTPVTQVSPVPQPISPTTNELPAWKHLGNNQQNVLVVVHHADTVHLPDDDLAFLTQLLGACKLALTDVAIINQNNYPGVSYTDILRHFKSKTVLLFGLSAAAFGFPFDVLNYQVQSFADYMVLPAPALSAMVSNRDAKSKLWTSLKKIFNL